MGKNRQLWGRQTHSLTQKERAVVCALIISHTVALRDRQPDDGVIYHRDKKECKNSELLLLVWGQTEHVYI